MNKATSRPGSLRWLFASRQGLIWVVAFAALTVGLRGVVALLSPMSELVGVVADWVLLAGIVSLLVFVTLVRKRPEAPPSMWGGLVAGVYTVALLVLVVYLALADPVGSVSAFMLEGAIALLLMAPFVYWLGELFELFWDLL